MSSVSCRDSVCVCRTFSLLTKQMASGSLVRVLTREHVYFGSRMSYPWYHLSNFYSAPLSLPADTWFSSLFPSTQAAFLAACPLLPTFLAEYRIGRGSLLVFPTTEHFWQALKSENLETFLAFTSSATDEARSVAHWNYNVFYYTVAKQDREATRKKLAEWGKKIQLGIQAKLVVNPSYKKLVSEHLGLKLRYDSAAEFLLAVVEERIWLMLLKLKYDQCEAFRITLQQTAGKELVEFNRGARRCPEKAYWNGYVDPKTKECFGQNKMDLYLMKLRDTPL